MQSKNRKQTLERVQRGYREYFVIALWMTTRKYFEARQENALKHVGVMTLEYASPDFSEILLQKIIQANKFICHSGRLQ